MVRSTALPSSVVYPVTSGLARMEGVNVSYICQTNKLFSACQIAANVL